MERLLGGRTRAERLGDVGLISGLAVVGLGGHLAAVDDVSVEAAPISVAFVVLAASAPLVVWWRRERPFLMFGVLILVAAVAAAVDDRGLFSLQVGLVIMVLAHAVGSWSTHLRTAVIALVITVLLVVAGSLGDGNSLLAASALGVALLGFPFAAGLASRRRRQYLHEVEQRLAAAERDRDEQARRAIADERARIARELHDVVAHHVSLIGVQAGAARSSLGSSPDATRRALRSIEESSRDAVGEMRRLLDVLRPVDGSADVREPGIEPPQPGVDRLPQLVQRWCDAGIDVDLAMRGVHDLPSAVSAAAHRIVEEALTNVARHSAAKRASVQVEVRAGVDADADADLAIVVHDPGPATDEPRTSPLGRGLIGMRERASVFGGFLDARPDGAGGFTVRASIPLRR